ncbi:MAG: hypothetical protein K9J74_10710 [Sulfuritalea sp.]|nr:hypothetical protein [Sulfuritalea sp.]
MAVKAPTTGNLFALLTTAVLLTLGFMLSLAESMTIARTPQHENSLDSPDWLKHMELVKPWSLTVER